MLKVLDRLDRRSFLKTGAAALCAASLPPRAGAAASGGDIQRLAAGKAFPFGTHIYREPSLPIEQLLADLPLLKRFGFTMVKLQESWSYDEQAEGHIDLGKVIRLVEAARRNDLSVVFGVTMEQAPMWFWRKYPDARVVLDTGQPLNDPTQYLLPSDGDPGPCWHNPHARQAGARFMSEVARQLGVYDNILVWNVKQEIVFEFDDSIRLHACFCPSTLAAFRSWLQKRYPSLARLNAAWRSGFGAWEEVEPPRRFAPVPSYLDWREFMDRACLADTLAWKAETFRKADPGHHAIQAHLPGRDPGSDALWAFAAEVDVFGSSFYPGWSEHYALAETAEERAANSPAILPQIVDIALRCDELRSAARGQNFWAAELQGGMAGAGLSPGRTPDAGDIRRWVLTLLAGGAHGVCFWNHRAETFWSEGYGFGLMPLDGNASPRIEEAGRIARAIASRAAALFAEGTAPAAEIAIVEDIRNASFLAGSGDRYPRLLSDDIRGIHQSLWLAGYPVDMLSAAQIAEKAGGYKLVVVPYALTMGEAEAQALAAYMEQGGMVLVDAGGGRFDSDGFGMAGERLPLLRKLLGIESGVFTDLSHLTDAAAIKLTGKALLDALQVVPAEALDSVLPTSAEPILAWKGAVYGARNRYGKGQAIYVGTLLGAASSEQGPANREAIAALAAAAGARRRSAGKLLLKERRLGAQRALFLTNPTHEAVVERLQLDARGKVTALLGDEVYDPAGFEVKVTPRDVLCLLYEANA